MEWIIITSLLRGHYYVSYILALSYLFSDRALDPYNLPEVEEDEIYHDFDPASVEEFHHHGLRHAGPKKSNPEI